MVVRVLKTSAVLGVFVICIETAQAAPRPIAALFPGVDMTKVDWTMKNIATGGGSLYQHFYDCANLRTAAACNAPDAFFFQFRNGNSPEESFNLVNRCMHAREDLSRADKGWVTLSAGTQSASCEPGPDEVDYVHLALCYESLVPSPGAYCRVALLCFSGEKANGGCGRDMPGDYAIAMKTPGSSALPPPTPTFCDTLSCPTGTLMHFGDVGIFSQYLAQSAPSGSVAKDASNNDHSTCALRGPGDTPVGSPYAACGNGNPVPNTWSCTHAASGTAYWLPDPNTGTCPW